MQEQFIVGLLVETEVNVKRVVETKKKWGTSVRAARGD